MTWSESSHWSQTWHLDLTPDFQFQYLIFIYNCWVLWSVEQCCCDKYLSLVLSCQILHSDSRNTMIYCHSYSTITILSLSHTWTCCTCFTRDFLSWIKMIRRLCFTTFWFADPCTILSTYLQINLIKTLQATVLMFSKSW